MSTYETDEEKVEALRKWWKDNGTSVIGGIVISMYLPMFELVSKIGG